MGLYRTFISLLLFSTMCLSFIYLMQVNDMELNARQVDYGNGSRSTKNSESLADHEGKYFDGPRELHTQSHWARVPFTTLTDSLHAFGVYLDDRYRPNYFLRILILQRGNNPTERLACKADGEAFNTWAERYEMCENHGKTYTGWIYSCLVTYNTKPDLKSVILNVYSQNGSLINSQQFAVTSLSPDSSTSTDISNLHRNIRNLSFKTNSNLGVLRSNQTLPILGSQNQKTPPKPKNKVTFKTDQRPGVSIGVCVPPLHSNLYIQNLIDFLEFCWILGANKVFLYIHDLPTDFIHTLSFYLKDKTHLFEILHWDLPANIRQKSYQVIWNNGQILAVQHCLYQNMANFDWLLFLDIDEMLIPKSVYNWQDLLPTVLKGSDDNVAALSFESAFFSWDFDSQVSSPIKYLRHLHRTKRTTVLHSKLLIQAKNVFEVGIHHLSRAVTDSMRVIRVPAEVALLHHYRACIQSDTEWIQCDLVIQDTSALKYETQLSASRDHINRLSQFT
ncbi:beta-1,4-galactosyltransferase galt-1-like [Biomphalaria glabrata]|uniref:Glycosyltransferase family 92 protein n=1 Tax=Biomphalaria glabrata TaxID=6526 RepID=A0A9W2Z1Z0_BIOGL|nr:beta-1,4-galactosyltransferase galt-1-like [Biomphalaria glabrata]XP_055868947.1 beta-1,4-galactosyltransferase galt-1-like [Biomphalaria glabrata]